MVKKMYLLVLFLVLVLNLAYPAETILMKAELELEHSRILPGNGLIFGWVKEVQADHYSNLVFSKNGESRNLTEHKPYDYKYVRNPEFLAGPSGVIIVVYELEQMFVKTNLIATLYDAQLNVVWSRQFTEETDYSFFGTRRSLVKGDSLIVFWNTSTNIIGSKGRIFAKYISLKSGCQLCELRINTMTNTDVISHASVASDGKNGYGVGWVDRRGANYPYVRVSNPTLMNEVCLKQETSKDVNLCYSNGQYLCIFTQGTCIYGCCINSITSEKDNPFLISDMPGQINTVRAFADNGKTIIAWTQYFELEKEWDIVIQRFENGRQKGNNIRISEPGQQYYIDDALILGEQILLTWTEREKGLLMHVRKWDETGPRTDVVVAGLQTPNSFELGQNYPNPFNPETTIKFAIPKTEKVTLVVYDLLGQEVTNLVDCVMAGGNHQVTFDGRNLASGVYFYQLQINNQIFTRKMQLLK